MINSYDIERSGTVEFEFDRFFLFILMLLPVGYFALAFPISIFIGINPATHYYDSLIENNLAVREIFFYNIVYVSVFLLTFSLFPKRLVIQYRSSSIWILVLALFITVYFNGENLFINRYEIKDKIDIFYVIFTSTTYAVLSGIILAEKNKLKLLIAIFILFANVILSFERELLLFLAFPLFIRFSKLKNSKYILFAFLPVLGFLLGGYKYFSNTIRAGDSVFFLFSEAAFWKEILRTLLSDNLHKAGLEISYFSGYHPEYSTHSYFLPLQIDRLFDADAMTNGQMATKFYTNNAVGTGFSALLEGWLNFGPLGVFLVPISLTLAGLIVMRSKSGWLLMAFLLFSLKVQRADLWPAIITIMLGPLILFFSLRTAKLLSIYQKDRKLQN